MTFSRDKRVDGRLTSRRGYSLLEVMLATAILAASSLVLASMISAGAQLGNRASRRTEATLVAQSLIDETLALRQGEVFDEQELFGSGESWSYLLRTEEDDQTGLIVITAEVYPVSESGDRRLGAAEANPSARLVRWYLPRTQLSEEGPGSFGQEGGL